MFIEERQQAIEKSFGEGEESGPGTERNVPGDRGLHP